MKSIKHTIQVVQNGILVKVIKRVLRAEQIGNFCPIFCTFDNRQRLVHSREGDLSDPFRRDDNYARTLYIEV